MSKHRHGRALRRRYGRSLMGPHAISRPAGGDMVDVIVVDPRGTPLGAPLARRVPYTVAKAIIKGYG